VEQAGELRVAQIMRDWVRVIALEPGALTYAVAPGFAGDPGADLRDALLKVSSERWTVTQGALEGSPTLREQAEARRAAADDELRRHPLVEAAFSAFPEAQFIADERPERVGGTRNWSERR
jgi:DNA polymerase-3 subunit gamma/tau